jgi:mono/diheme cytochrome c family protein
MKPKRILSAVRLAGRIATIAAALVVGGCSKSKPAPATPAVPPAQPPSATQAVLPVEPAQGGARHELLAAGKQAFENYCASCHGESGDGNGPAARFLFPKPRNFRDGKYRLVTTTNRVPSDDDLLHAINRGMPGSAMFPFEHLSDADRSALVAYVRQLTRAGVEDRMRKVAEEAGDIIDPVELAADVDQRTKPGKTIELAAELPAFGDESNARGRQIYLKQGCASCHGENGKGDGVQAQLDDDGSPTGPRDYTRGIFKGGREREQLYARTLLGMPGSPMPSSSNLKPAEIADLVNYLQSLSDPSAQRKVQHKRTQLIAKRAADSLPDEIPVAAWESVSAASIVVSPLWWRDYAEPDLQIQAMHDGRTIAIRLTWHDASRNEHAVRPQDFEDQVAVQLFKGTREPFLGMGSTDGVVDLWVWNAGWQADLVEYADVDTQYPNMFVDEYQLEEKGDGPRPHATTRQNKTFLAGFAAGNLRSDPTRGIAGSANQAKGFGTLTLLPRPAQAVIAKGVWSAGRWSVVLRRPLSVSADSGLQLGADEKLSIAFAIWDGAARDRDGQKLVSIWHDLELE